MTREEEADRALRHTDLGPGVAAALILVLLLCICSVPLLQIAADQRDGKEPQIKGFARLLPTRAKLRQARGKKQKLLALLPAPESIRDLEKNLEENSLISAALLPPTQMFLTGTLGAGNKQVYAGRGISLHYFEDVDYLTAAEPSLTPESERFIVAGIIDIQRQLAARGIALIVLPIPPKTVLYPETLSPRFSGDRPVENGSMIRLKERLREAGVMVCDVVPLLAEEKRRTKSFLWMPTDSHWSPEGMDFTARALARFIQQRVVLPPTPPVDLVLHTKETPYRGDLTRLLHFPPVNNRFNRILIRPQTVATRDGQPWKLRPDADVVLVGDSLSDAFDAGNASLAHHLSYYLKRPVDRITDPTRRSPPMVYASQEITAHPERLRGKWLLIWEFHGRDIRGDLDIFWRHLDLNLPKDAGPASAPHTASPGR